MDFSEFRNEYCDIYRFYLEFRETDFISVSSEIDKRAIAIEERHPDSLIVQHLVDAVILQLRDEELQRKEKGDE